MILPVKVRYQDYETRESFALPGIHLHQYLKNVKY